VRCDLSVSKNPEEDQRKDEKILLDLMSGSEQGRIGETEKRPKNKDQTKRMLHETPLCHFMDLPSKGDLKRFAREKCPPDKGDPSPIVFIRDGRGFPDSTPLRKSEDHL